MNADRAGQCTLDISTPPGKTALEVLRERGAAPPSDCGGKGACGQCRVRVIRGQFNPWTSSEEELLTPQDRTKGMRLACRLQGSGRVRFDAPHAASSALALQHNAGGKVQARYGVAVDVGTTTLRLSLLDWPARRRLCAVQTLNAQAAFGADVMSRLAAAMQGQGSALAQVIRAQLFEQIAQLASSCNLKTEHIERVVLVGNTAMTHLLLGEEVEALALAPYRSPLEGQGSLTRKAGEWGWALAPGAACQMLPVACSFVGSDLLADLVEIDMQGDERLTLVLDLGTNGEVALGNSYKIWCASAAAGCAFEATSLHCGVGARPGAVWRVRWERDRVCVDALGDQPPIGFCGSGSLSALALLRRLGWLDPGGRILADSPAFRFNGQASVTLAQVRGGKLEITQDDVRQIQLAKGAIAAATQILLEQAHVGPAQLERVILIGNFGGRLDVEAALELGLLPPVPASRVEVRQEATLLGAERALCAEAVERAFARLAQQVEWISLVEREGFLEKFAEAMALQPQEHHVRAD